MEQLVQAIQNKYNISSDEATKVVQTLVQVEQKRQAVSGAGDAPSGMRGASRGVGSDIMGLLGGMMSSSGGGQQGNQPGITDDLMGLVGGMMSSGQQSGQGGLGGLMGDLLGDSGQQGNQPGITDDVMGLVGGLLASSGQQGTQGGNENDPHRDGRSRRSFRYWPRPEPRATRRKSHGVKHRRTKLEWKTR